MRYDLRADQLIGIIAGAVMVLALVAGVAWGLTRDDADDPAAGADTTASGPIDDRCAHEVQRATLAMRAAAVDRLTSSGATIAALPPGGDLGRGAATVPVDSATTINCGLTTGRIVTDGGLRFDVAGQATDITDLVVDFDSQTMGAETRSPGFDGVVSSAIDTTAVDGLDRGGEVVYVIPINLLSNEAGTLDDALQKAALSDGSLPTDATLTIVGAKRPPE